MLAFGKQRFDHEDPGEPSFVALWAIELKDQPRPWRECLVAVYALDDKSDRCCTRHRGDVTHEFAVFAVHPQTPVDYGRSLFDQPDLSPLNPPRVVFQFAANSNLDAVQRVSRYVGYMRAGDLPPRRANLAVWRQLFADGVSLLPREKRAA